jgi:hypothetical protein
MERTWDSIPTKVKKSGKSQKKKTKEWIRETIKKQLFTNDWC